MGFAKYAEDNEKIYEERMIMKYGSRGYAPRGNTGSKPTAKQEDDFFIPSSFYMERR